MEFLNILVIEWRDDSGACISRNFVYWKCCEKLKITDNTFHLHAFLHTLQHLPHDKPGTTLHDSTVINAMINNTHAFVFHFRKLYGFSEQGSQRTDWGIVGVTVVWLQWPAVYSQLLDEHGWNQRGGTTSADTYSLQQHAYRNGQLLRKQGFQVSNTIANLFLILGSRSSGSLTIPRCKIRVDSESLCTSESRVQA